MINVQVIIPVIQMFSMIKMRYGEDVWKRIVPGLAYQFDSPYTIPVTVPRPAVLFLFLMVSGRFGTLNASFGTRLIV
ncbi:hypothetical protein AQUCO_04200002v1 [Aquilegia coerulea]|uniref:Uncharacterized protein n=1 Tax=Aquilegia coerulea TaxID=218851 RepID=A0A2G5CP47_AQUCA|nr:hypothetical protein AQUCO_04200002v1 [Aquilegia coerulea]